MKLPASHVCWLVLTALWGTYLLAQLTNWWTGAEPDMAMIVLGGACFVGSAVRADREWPSR